MSSPLKQNTTTIQELLNTINALPEEVILPELTNPADASKALSGYEFINEDCEKVTGTIPTKTASNLTASGATVTVPAGYYASQTTKSVATTTQATPTITINASGKITATATQTAGYVAAGTKSATKQLAFQPAKTITPSTTSQTAVSSGYYTGGNITVAAVPTQSKTVTPTSTTQNITPDSGKFLSKVTVNGDSDLVAGNIKSGVNIFGVTGTYAGSGGGDTSAEDGVITKTISGAYVNDRVTSIGNYAFYNCSKLTTASFLKVTSIGNSAFYYCYSLTTASFPKVTSIGKYAFYDCYSLTTASFPVATSIGNSAFCGCRSLTTASFPVATSIGNSAFYYCYSLTTASFPKVTSIGNYAFYDCYSLTTASFPVATSIGNSAFCYCYNLKSLYLTGSSLCRLSNSKAFTSTPIGGYSTSAGTYGSIYVPKSLLTAYKAATNWTYFSSRFVGYGGDHVGESN